ncbi:pseudouridine synthase domain-containing protein [Levilactobacillus fujinensis]|uniref:16S rRNA pseudouridylate synthase n=1 Tax=Levilactobacillus fujinensis TaxID=2486024 RepID=A0ABW1TCP1_9LACO|nr:16S rRNA pseudouridylate synthase [Levilactobacillus fujinensis]
MNIERYLTEHRQGTPLQILRLLRQGRVTVNSDVIDSPRTTVVEADNVRVDGMTVTGRQPQYLVFNKPVGFQLSMDPTMPHSLGSLLNAFDQPRQLDALADLPKEAVGLVLTSDDVRFLTDVTGQNWPSRFQVQVSGTVVPTLAPNQAFQDVTMQVDQVHQQVTVALTTIDSAMAVAALEKLPDVLGPVERLAVGPLRLPVDLPVGAYRGLLPTEIDELTGPLDEKIKTN